MRTTFDFISDPGHGCLKVNTRDLFALGLTPADFSSYSYRLGDDLYLEEDCDASRLMEAAKAAGIVIQLKPFYSNKNSKIRGYAQYQAPGGEIVQFMREHFQLIHIGG
jgi:hypothetical protein